MEYTLILIVIALASAPFAVLLLSKPGRRQDRLVAGRGSVASRAAYRQARKRTEPENSGTPFIAAPSGAGGGTRAAARLRRVRRSTRHGFHRPEGRRGP